MTHRTIQVEMDELPDLPEPWRWDKDWHGGWAARKGTLDDTLVSIEQSQASPLGSITMTTQGDTQERFSAPISALIAVARANGFFDSASDKEAVVRATLAAQVQNLIRHLDADRHERGEDIFQQSIRRRIAVSTATAIVAATSLVVTGFAVGGWAPVVGIFAALVMAGAVGALTTRSIGRSFARRRSD